MSRNAWLRATVALCLLLAAPSLGAATDADYKMPPDPLAGIVDTPPTPTVSLSPDRTWMLLIERPNLPSIVELAEPELRLAGRRIRPRTNGPSRGSYVTGLTLKRMSDLFERPVTNLPDGARLGNPRWSPDGKRIAFTVTGETDIQLWVAEVADGLARRVPSGRLNATAGTPFRWLPDSRRIVCTAVPEGRGAEPTTSRVPGGPVVQENIGKIAPARTYQDLLQNAHDEKLFEYYLTSQLVLVDVERKSKKIGAPGIVWDFDPSPDGRLLLVEIIHRPFSYLVPASRFPRRIEVWDYDGNLVHQVADLELKEEVPTGFGSVPTGPRSVNWRSDAPATLYWTEAQDGGDSRREAEIRDTVFMVEAPFEETPRKLIDLGFRYGGIQWGTDEIAVVTEWWWRTRQARGWRIEPGRADAEPDLLMDLSFEDRYADPGDPVTRTNAAGRSVLMLTAQGDDLFLIGAGASEEGDRPFLDTFDLETKESKRLWRSEAPYYEMPVEPLDDRGRKVLTRRESRDEPPNYFVRDLKTGELRQLTEFPHPTPQLQGITKEQIRYERDDGIMLTGTLYLPAGYNKEDGPLPILLWAYPQEFKSADAAGQVTDSPYRFDRVGWWSSLLFLTLGYAVLDDPTLPIVGEGEEEPNDTFVTQLVSGARAAIDEVVRRGVADPDRVAVGGHSYGAFMTANLLAHSDLFRAGIARSGAYNRTLTPFGFQAEERTLWEAPDVYFAMSPFMHASEVDEPILLIHGEADNNSGTFPMQSERFYNALKGHGATTRLVMLPHESHGYRSRESIMHMLWEMATWLDTHVKNAPPREIDGTSAEVSPTRATADGGEYWPQWRGPDGNGLSPGGDPPTTWSETENIKFKVAIPGRGLSTPIVWKNRVFVLSAVPVDEEAFATAQQAAAQQNQSSRRPPKVQPLEQRFIVMALDRSNGSVVWEKTATKGTPREGHHSHASWASASPVTDGKRLIAHFGSNGTYAYDLDGKLLWKTDLGDMTTRNAFGEGSSPVLHGDTVVINWDHEGDSFIVALDARTGKQRWKVDRPEEPTSWSTPLVVRHGDRDQVVVPGTGKSRGYDLENGKELWSVGGMTTNTIPTPVHREGVVYLMSGFRGNALQAIALAHASGSLEGTEAMVWTYDQHTPYVPSPLLYDDSLYFLKHLTNILSILDADNGEVRLTEQRLPGLHGVYASPVGAAGRVYFFDRDGHAVVLKHGEGFEVLAENTLEDGVDASPAIAGDELFVRGHEHLYCIAKP